MGWAVEKPLMRTSILSKVRIMRWNTTFSWICLLTVGMACLSSPLPAQTENLKNTIYLWRQESEERYRQLKADLEDAQEANNALLKRMEALERENRSLRSNLAKVPTAPVSETDLKRLSDQLLERIKTVDAQRAEDNRLLVEQIKQLAKAIDGMNKAPAVPSHTPSKPARRVKTSAELKIEPGWTLSAIAEAYRQDGYKVSVADILEANPKITDPKKIRSGETIIIPIEWE